jgi:transcriptional regulator with XRE-family HTH domain
MYPNLKLVIFKKGLHQNNLARNVGMDETLLSKIIHGYREPTAVQRRSLAGYLAVAEEWLFESYDVTSHNSDKGQQDSASGSANDEGT